MNEQDKQLERELRHLKEAYVAWRESGSQTGKASLGAEIEKWRNMAGELGSRLDSLLNRYTGLVNCGDCGTWDPEEEPVVKNARASIEKYSKL